MCVFVKEYLVKKLFFSLIYLLFVFLSKINNFAFVCASLQFLWSLMSYEIINSLKS